MAEGDNFLDLPEGAAAAGVRDLDKGECLFRQGDPSQALFRVISGRLSMVRHLQDGRRVTLHVARPGEGLAEAALFSPVYHCDAVADRRSRVAVHSRRAVLDALEADPAAALRFMAGLARQVMSLRSRLELRNVRPARERVLCYLLLAADGATGRVRFDGPLKDAAGEVGLTPEAFYRALAELERRGEIERRGRTIQVVPSRKT